MPKRKATVPSYRLHRPSGQGVVTLNGRDFYLGPYRDGGSRDRYEELLGHWFTNGRRMSDEVPQAHVLTTGDLILRYYRHCEERFGHRRTKGTRLSQVRVAMQPVKQLFGSTPAADFGPKSLLLVRQLYIDGGWDRRVRRSGETITEKAKPWARKTVNDHVQVVKRMVKWGVREELIPESVWHGLSTVDGLRSGESAAPEPRKVRPVPEEHVDAVLPHVLPPVKAMIELQRLTGMRPGEVVIMRGRDLDMVGDLWAYKPEHHKSEHRGIERVIVVGERGQKIIGPFLRSNVDECLFRPDEAEANRHAEQRRRRKTPLWKAHVERYERARKRRSRRVLHDHYTVTNYARAVTRACEKAGVPKWTPHQLRHLAATNIRKAYGIEAARIMLGHQHIGVTEIYAERDLTVARTIAAKIG